MMSHHVRRALPADLAALDRLRQALFGRGARAFVHTEPFGFVIEHGGELLGHATFLPGYGPRADRAPAVRLASLTLAPGGERPGLAAALVDGALEALAERGVRWCRVAGTAAAPRPATTGAARGRWLRVEPAR